MGALPAPYDRLFGHRRTRDVVAGEGHAETHAGTETVARIGDCRANDEIAAVAGDAGIRGHDARVDRIVRIGKGRHLHHLPFTQRREHFLGGGKVDVEPAALVDLRDRCRVAHAVAGIDIGQADMAGERGPDDPVGEFGLRLPQCNTRRGERGFACLDLAFGNRAGILDPTVATE